MFLQLLWHKGNILIILDINNISFIDQTDIKI